MAKINETIFAVQISSITRDTDDTVFVIPEEVIHEIERAVEVIIQNQVGTTVVVEAIK